MLVTLQLKSEARKDLVIGHVHNAMGQQQKVKLDQG
jgi:hypothetical protein